MALGTLHPSEDKDEKIGLFFSLIIHGLFVLLVLIKSALGNSILEESPIYTVSLEGGKNIGGKTQVAPDDTKTTVTPPKNVSNEKKIEQKKEEKVEVKEETKKIEPTKEEKKEEDPNAISLATPVATKAPSSKPTADKGEEKKVATKSTPKTVPTKKATPPPSVDEDYMKSIQKHLGDSVNAGGSGYGATKLGGSGFGGGIVKPREVLLYEETLKAIIKGNWRFFGSQGTLVAAVQIKIAPDGSIVGEQIMRSSGDPEFDDSALRAVKASNPLPPPPQQYYNQYFKITNFEFDPRKF